MAYTPCAFTPTGGEYNRQAVEIKIQERMKEEKILDKAVEITMEKLEKAANELTHQLEQALAPIRPILSDTITFKTAFHKFKYSATIWIRPNEELERPSLSRYWTGVDNIIGLLNEGYDAQGVVKGIWDSRDIFVMSKQHRRGMFFLENFKATYEPGLPEKYGMGKVAQILIDKLDDWNVR